MAKDLIPSSSATPLPGGLPLVTPAAGPKRPADAGDSGRAFADEVGRGHDRADNEPKKAGPIRQGRGEQANQGERSERRDPARAVDDLDLQRPDAAHRSKSQAPTKSVAAKDRGDGDADRESPSAAAGDAPRARHGSEGGLAPLRRAAVGQQDAIGTAPIIALLTGKVERLDPATLPDLIANNSFVSSALGQDDLAAFMTQPLTLKELAANLDLPQSLLADAKRLGLRDDQVVAPQELLKALGVDPQRVFAELKVLKDNLALEGVSGYMQRATTLRGADPTRLDLDGVVGRIDANSSQRPATRVPPLAGSGLGSGPQPTVAPLAPPTIGKGAKGDGQRELTPDAAAFLAAALASGQGSLRAPSGPVLAPSAATADMVTPGMGAAALDPSRSLSQLLDARQLAEAPVAPQAHAATFDAFALLGDRLKVMDDVRISDGKADVQPSGIADDLVNGDRRLVDLTAVTAAAERIVPSLSLDGKAPKAGPLVATSADEASLSMVALPRPNPVAGGERTAPLPYFLSSPDGSSLDKAAFWANNLQVGPSASIDRPALAAGRDGADAMARIPLEQLRLNTVMMSGAGADGRSGAASDDRSSGQQPNSDRGLAAVAEDNAAAPVAAGLHGVATGASHAHAASGMPQAAATEAPLNNAQRLELIQQVMDRATALIKGPNHGVMRLDLSHVGLGPIQLAMSFKGDQMDLRVVTGSKPVREAMMDGLGQLQQALATQNLQLGKVEVGLTGRDSQSAGQRSFQQAFAQGQPRQQFSGQGFDREQARSWRDFDSALVRPVAAPARAALSGFRAPVAGIQPAAEGRIAVRI